MIEHVFWFYEFILKVAKFERNKHNTNLTKRGKMLVQTESKNCIY